jgi:hypothetical protein
METMGALVERVLSAEVVALVSLIKGMTVKTGKELTTQEP